MIDIGSQLKRAADRGKWAARGGGFVAKVKATKLVWFPPKPADTGTKVPSAAGRGTQRATTGASGAAKKTKGAAKKTTGAAAKKSTRAAKKTARSTGDAVRRPPAGKGE